MTKERKFNFSDDDFKELHSPQETVSKEAWIRYLLYRAKSAKQTDTEKTDDVSWYVS